MISDKMRLREEIKTPNDQHQRRKNEERECNVKWQQQQINGNWKQNGKKGIMNEKRNPATITTIMPDYEQRSISNRRCSRSFVLIAQRN